MVGDQIDVICEGIQRGVLRTQGPVGGRQGGIRSRLYLYARRRRRSRCEPCPGNLKTEIGVTC